jgi:hypothetical protein
VASSGVGLPLILSAQQGAAGQLGGNVIINSGAKGAAGANGAILFGTGGAVSAAGVMTAGERMRIDAEGNVGIGQPNPQWKLHVTNSDDNGHSRIVSETNGSPNYGEASIALKTPDGQWDWFMDDKSGNELGIGNLGLWHSGFGLRMVINANGNVCIGANKTPGYKLEVSGNSGNATGVWATVSDERLKRDIRPLEGSLGKVRALRGVSFRWKDDEKDRAYGIQRGFIAQEVESVIPEWVKTSEDGTKSLEKIGVEALLVEAIKEQQAQIESLKSMVCGDHPGAAACK